MDVIKLPVMVAKAISICRRLRLRPGWQEYGRTSPMIACIISITATTTAAALKAAMMIEIQLFIQIYISEKLMLRLLIPQEYIDDKQNEHF